MPRVVLASALTRWLSPGATQAVGEVSFDSDGARLAEVLDDVFARHPNLRGFVLDERGVPRHHVALFVDGQALRDKTNLRVALAPGSEVYIMQALSGG